MFGSYLDALGDRCRLLLVDERGTGRSEPSAPETWELTHHAADIEAMAGTLGLERYAVLGHSYGAFIALQHAVDFPGRPAATIVSSGIPGARFLAHVEAELAAFEPVELREQVQRSWAAEAHARTQEDVAALLSDQLPFHFADPRDPRIDELRAAMGDAVYGPDVLRAAATGGLRRDRRRGPPRRRRPPGPRARRAPRPHLLGAGGRGDGRAACPTPSSVVFEHSGHMAFVEENEAYLAAVRDFLERRALG